MTVHVFRLPYPHCVLLVRKTCLLLAAQGVFSGLSARHLQVTIIPQYVLPQMMPLVVECKTDPATVARSAPDSFSLLL